jgi:hypothetical protein
MGPAPLPIEPAILVAAVVEAAHAPGRFTRRRRARGLNVNGIYSITPARALS